MGERRRILFVTGKLAEPALRRVLGEMGPEIECGIAVLRITVASLMTTPWIARHLTVPEGTDLVMIPGLCEGDTAIIAHDPATGLFKAAVTAHQAGQFPAALEFLQSSLAARVSLQGLLLLAEVQQELGEPAKAASAWVQAADLADSAEILRFNRVLGLRA